MKEKQIKPKLESTPCRIEFEINLFYTAATFRRPEGAGWAVPPSLFDPALDDVEIAGRTCAVKVTARRRQLGGLVSRQWGVN
ncbi:hypothetical protein PCASD_01215 [Puccinia coronata f. sp. avenae]|uniref:Uncharacterized protein n=1 Tax=Puccinia coronata f. sp. avenae TaxID=200324 RepID=A0A2N5VLZ9_9BASI|nr:hypothetical protein PCASD_01215 [Puccinia coronata f. sp. avenae]